MLDPCLRNSPKQLQGNNFFGGCLLSELGMETGGCGDRSNSCLRLLRCSTPMFCECWLPFFIYRSLRARIIEHGAKVSKIPSE